MEVEGLPRHDLDATPGDLQLKPDLRTNVLVATADKLWTWTDRSLSANVVRDKSWAWPVRGRGLG